MRTMTATLIVASLLTVFAPVAAAEPQCLEVYPWSELCEGDVGGFIGAFGLLDCGKDCISFSTGGPSVDCIQAVPYSYLCSGDIDKFLAYYLGDGLALS